MIREADGRLYVSGPVTMDNALELLESGSRFLRGFGLGIAFAL